VSIDRLQEKNCKLNADKAVPFHPDFLLAALGHSEAPSSAEGDALGTTSRLQKTGKKFQIFILKYRFLKLDSSGICLARNKRRQVTYAAKTPDLRGREPDLVFPLDR
jgi:hypothetical protein